MNMSFADETFDAVTASFGIRNFQSLDKGLAEMCRVLKKGGRLAIVELTTPQRFPMKQLFGLYSHTILPLYGNLISRLRGILVPPPYLWHLHPVSCNQITYYSYGQIWINRLSLRTLVLHRVFQ